MKQGLVILMALTCSLRDELRILSKRLDFAGNLWRFAICTNCFEKYTYCFANVEHDSRNIPKRLRKTVIWDAWDGLLKHTRKGQFNG